MPDPTDDSAGDGDATDQGGDDGPEYDIDFRDEPERYEIGRGEEGVFKVEPYKSELLPLWSYADEAAARESAQDIYERYERYRANDDFPGMDMARKYLQMGYTRAMRYAKYPGGRKYDESDGGEREPQQWADPDKRAGALVFESYWERVREDERYQRAKDEHQNP
ncbi:protein of unknown function [Natronorubrum sediminis]|uniref:DUF4385 domain-containing protein n=1 Tax=Natronorubrum sediminis TaxID=640943 RepID=A0A1H6FQP0_9EURY|nr:DUF4385 domain-containing protein [Natronorubrum sediminis]SEH13241.1 protein of unknown function [Natronorubrum sediminis]